MIKVHKRGCKRSIFCCEKLLSTHWWSVSNIASDIASPKNGFFKTLKFGSSAYLGSLHINCWLAIKTCRLVLYAPSTISTMFKEFGPIDKRVKAIILCECVTVQRQLNGSRYVEIDTTNTPDRPINKWNGPAELQLEKWSLTNKQNLHSLLFMSIEKIYPRNMSLPLFSENQSNRAHFHKCWRNRPIQFCADFYFQQWPLIAVSLLHHSLVHCVPIAQSIGFVLVQVSFLHNHNVDRNIIWSAFSGVQCLHSSRRQSTFHRHTT